MGGPGHQRRVGAPARRHRTSRRPASAPVRRTRRSRPTSALPAARGRWSLVAPLLLPVATQKERARALAEVLLERHGVVTRAAVLAEGVPGGFSAVYGELRAMEEAGLCQRGYFVEGLGGAQFALPAAVERLRICATPIRGPKRWCSPPPIPPTRLA